MFWINNLYKVYYIYMWANVNQRKWSVIYNSVKLKYIYTIKKYTEKIIYRSIDIQYL